LNQHAVKKGNSPWGLGFFLRKERSLRSPNLAKKPGLMKYRGGGNRGREGAQWVDTQKKFLWGSKEKKQRFRRKRALAELGNRGGRRIGIIDGRAGVGVRATGRQRRAGGLLERNLDVRGRRPRGPGVFEQSWLGKGKVERDGNAAYRSGI